MSVALVGTGPRGRILSSAFSKKVDVTRVLKHGESSRLFSKSRHIELSSAAEIIADETIDAVIIATPIEVLSECIDIFHGHKHLFVEKPGAKTSTFEMSRPSDKVTYVNFSWLLEDFEFPASGDIHINWTKPHTFCRDLTINLLVHPVSLCISKLGMPVYSSVVHRNEAVEADLIFENRKVKVEIVIQPNEYEEIVISGAKYNRGNRKMTIDAAVEDFLCATRGEHRHVPDLEFARKVIQCIGR